MSRLRVLPSGIVIDVDRVVSIIPDLVSNDWNITFEFLGDKFFPISKKDYDYILRKFVEYKEF